MFQNIPCDNGTSVSIRCPRTTVPDSLSHEMGSRIVELLIYIAVRMYSQLFSFQRLPNLSSYATGVVMVCFLLFFFFFFLFAISFDSMPEQKPKLAPQDLSLTLLDTLLTRYSLRSDGAKRWRWRSAVHCLWLRPLSVCLRDLPWPPPLKHWNWLLVEGLAE